MRNKRPFSDMKDKEECKHEWVGEKWKPETQSCKHCGIAWYDVYPKYQLRIEHNHYWGADYLPELSTTIVICRTCGEIKSEEH